MLMVMVLLMLLLTIMMMMAMAMLMVTVRTLTTIMMAMAMMMVTSYWCQGPLWSSIPLTLSLWQLRELHNLPFFYSWQLRELYIFLLLCSSVNFIIAFFLGSSVNFIIYCIFGEKFRRVLLQRVAGCKNYHHRTHSSLRQELRNLEV